MRMKPFLQRMVDSHALEPVSFSPSMKECAWCHKQFEMLSPEWKYRGRKKGSAHEYMQKTDGDVLVINGWLVYRFIRL